LAVNESTPEVIPSSDLAGRGDALALIFRHLPPEEGTTHFAAAEEALASRPEASRLVVIRRDNRVAAAAWGQLQPGRAALLWIPRVADAEAPDAERLLVDLRQWARRNGAVLAQLLLDRTTPSERRLLRAAGFSHLADLAYLGCTADEFPPGEPLGPLSFEPYDAAQHHRLERAVAQTYQGTCDCPELNGLQRIEDVLEGYRASGQFRPEHWLLARHAGQDVGCLLLADHPDHENMELVYMGVAPAWRGRAFGVEIVRRAMWMASRMRRERFILAVDTRNTPAISVYVALGLRQWQRRVVYYCPVAE